MTVENVLPPNMAYLILSIPGTKDPIHKTYVNCRAVWVGDTLTVNSGQMHVASYHRSLVLLAENRGPVPSVNIPSSTQPSQNGMQNPSQSPNDTPTQLIPTVPSGAAGAPAQAPTASMQMRPVPAPNLGNGSSANFPQPPSSGDDAEEGELDRDFQETVAKLVPHNPPGSSRLDFQNLQKSDTESSMSVDLAPSGWQAAKQLVLSRSGDRDTSRGTLRQSGNALARKAGRVAHTHRKRYMDKTKTFFEKFLSLTTHGAQVAARISTMVLFTGWASEEVNA